MTVIENNELRLLLPPPGGSKGFAGAARPVSSFFVVAFSKLVGNPYKESMSIMNNPRGE